MPLCRRLAALAPLLLRRIVNIHRLHTASTQHVKLLLHLHKGMLMTVCRFTLGLDNLPMPGSLPGHPRNRDTNKRKEQTTKTFHTSHFMMNRRAPSKLISLAWHQLNLWIRFTTFLGRNLQKKEIEKEGHRL